jgi:AraC-like DNA-binding protein
MNNKEIFEDLTFPNNYPFNISYHNSPDYFPIHWHNYVEIIYSMQDAVLYEVCEKQYTLVTGDILFIWPGELHALIHQPQPSNVIILQFDDHLLTERRDFRDYMYLFHHTRYLPSNIPQEFLQNLRNLLIQLKNVFISKDSFVESKSYMFLYEFFIILAEELKSTPSLSSSPVTLHHSKVIQQLNDTCNYLAAHCTEDLSLEYAANYSGFSKYHFSKLFKQYTGQSFPEFLAVERLRAAETLLNNPNLSITQVASEAGFNSISSFNRIFKYYKKVSPTEFRNLHMI